MCEIIADKNRRAERTIRIIVGEEMMSYGVLLSDTERFYRQLGSVDMMRIKDTGLGTDIH